jgi:stalled ribosome rescue protein Dom34
MTTGTYAVVWIDHHEARVIFVSHDGSEELVLHPEHSQHHLCSKAGSPEGRRRSEDHVFYQKIANDLAKARGFLVVGPANAKTEFVKHLHRYEPRLIERLSAIESMERLTDPELVAAAKRYFKRADQLIPLSTLTQASH